MDGGREFWHSGEGGFIADEGPSTSRGDSCEPDETRLSRGGALGARERARDRRCCACSSANTDASFLEAFGVWVCRSCKRSPGFDLVPKAKAKQMYLLTNAELAELGCITRPNPMNKQWTSMSLYLKSQVRDKAADVLPRPGNVQREAACKSSRVMHVWSIGWREIARHTQHKHKCGGFSSEGWWFSRTQSSAHPSLRVAELHCCLFG